MVQNHKGRGDVVSTPLVKKINYLFEDGFSRRFNGFNNLFGGTDKVTYHLWVKKKIYSQCYFYSRMGYAALLGEI
ncbi:hypothetical protein AMTRI_Chr04g252630 [Amborella trichopoda]